MDEFTAFSSLLARDNYVSKEPRIETQTSRQGQATTREGLSNQYDPLLYLTKIIDLYDLFLYNRIFVSIVSRYANG